MIGAMLLWVGWFGFNGGSAFAAGDGASAAIINTHAAAATAALVWIAIERVTFGKPTTIGFATGAIAGLATVTPAAGMISPGAAILFGALAAVLCYGAIQLVKLKLLIDDSLDVFAVHGVGGMLGTALLALFLSPALGGTGYAEGMALGSQLGAQAIAIVAVAIYSAIATALVALGVSLFLPMRVSEEDERQGLDVANHGERAWEFD
jgi:Amt family ammonium transporter